MQQIEALGCKLSLQPQESGSAKEFLCSVFDGSYLPRDVLSQASIVAAACIYVIRRQNLAPISVLVLAEAAELREPQILERLLNELAEKMRIVWNDIDATEIVRHLCKTLRLHHPTVDIPRVAIHLIKTAKQCGRPISKNPSALAAAALVKVVKSYQQRLDYAELAEQAKVSNWSIKSAEEELDKLLLGIQM